MTDLRGRALAREAPALVVCDVVTSLRTGRADGYYLAH